MKSCRGNLNAILNAIPSVEIDFDPVEPDGQDEPDESEEPDEAVEPDDRV